LDHLKGRDMIGLDGFNRQEVEEILDRGERLKVEWNSGRRSQSLAGKSVAMIFEKPSTRTRVSFEAGIQQLGGHALFLAGHELQLSRGEPIKDTARVMSRYVQAVVIRANRHEDVIEFARHASVPVINGLTDLLHPCQILADLMTAREAGADLDSARIAFIGDGNNVANSWVNAASLFGFRLVISCPQGYQPDAEIMKKAKSNGAKVVLERDPKKAAADADFLYTDVWVSMGQEEEKAKRLKEFEGYQVNAELAALASPQVKIMHCLPAHRGEEISDDLIEGEKSIVFDQAENRLHVQKAVLELLAGDGNG